MRWQRSPTIAAAVVGLWLAVQLVVPIWRLTSDGQDRFAWRMFSTFEARPTYVVHTGDEERIVDLEAVTARLRGDLDLVAHLPEHLCITVPEAVRITWDDDGEYACPTP